MPGEIAGVESQRRRIVGGVNGKPGDTVLLRCRDQLVKALLDGRVGEAPIGIDAKGDGRELRHLRLRLAVHLAALHMFAIVLQPVETVAFEAGQFRVEDGLGEITGIGWCRSRTSQGVEDEGPGIPGLQSDHVVGHMPCVLRVFLVGLEDDRSHGMQNVFREETADQVAFVQFHQGWQFLLTPVARNF